METESESQSTELEWVEYSTLKLKLCEKKRDEAKALIRSGCKLSKPGEISWDTPLHITLKNKDIEILDMLLERGTLQQSSGSATLRYAIETKNSVVIGKILDKLNDTDRSFLANCGLSPLAIACLRNDLDGVEDLTRCGSRVNDLAVSRSSPLCSSTGGLEDENGQLDWSGYAALHVAIELEKREIVETLLANGADVNKPSSKGSTPLHLAVKVQNSRIVSLLLSHRNKKGKRSRKKQKLSDSCAKEGIADVNAVDLKGDTPLLLAAELQSIKIIRLLRKYGADVRITDATGSSLLHRAIRNGCTKVVRFILRSECRHCHMREPEDGACAISMPRLVNAADNSGNSLLHLAIEKGFLEVVHWFLSHGAYRNFQNKRGLSPLHLAAQKADAGIVRSLLYYNFVCSDDDSSDEIEDEFFTLLPTDKFGDPKVEALINIRDFLDNTPLHYAAASFTEKNFSCLEVLINSGADVSISNYKNQSPLHILARRKPAISSEEEDAKKLFLCVKEKMLNAMLNVDRSCQRHINPTDDEGFSHFHAACTRDDPKTVEAFLRIGAHIGSTIVPNSNDWPGYGPLHFAAENNCTEVVQLLLDRGADIDSESASGWLRDQHTEKLVLIRNKSPTHLAVRHGCVETVKQLLTLGTDIDCSDQKGNNFFHELVMRNRYTSYEGLRDDSDETMEEIIDLLHEFGSNMNLQNKEGMTPLFVASLNRNRTMIKLLLRNGANINITNFESATPPMLWNEYPPPENFDTERIIPEIFRNYLIKQRALDIPLVSQNVKWFESVYVESASECDLLTKLCVDETRMLRNVRLGPLTLFDVVIESSDHMAKYVTDVIFEKFMRDRNVLRRFPNYADLIMLRYKACKYRWKCMRPASAIALDVTDLNEDSCREIMHYLANKELKRLCMLPDVESRSVIVRCALYKSKNMNRDNIINIDRFLETPYM